MCVCVRAWVCVRVCVYVCMVWGVGVGDVGGGVVKCINNTLIGCQTGYLLVLLKHKLLNLKLPISMHWTPFGVATCVSPLPGYQNTPLYIVLHIRLGVWFCK